jgi:hypothetical protein
LYLWGSDWDLWSWLGGRDWDLRREGSGVLLDIGPKVVITDHGLQLLNLILEVTILVDDHFLGHQFVNSLQAFDL